MLVKTAGDIDKEIKELRSRIEVLEQDRFMLINVAQPIESAWRDTCNYTDEYGD